jgi:hypothetical protein
LWRISWSNKDFNNREYVVCKPIVETDVHNSHLIVISENKNIPFVETDKKEQ